MTTTNEIIHTLRHGGLVMRTALWLLPSEQLTSLPDSAARLGIHLLDARQPLLDSIASDQRFLRLTVRDFIESLDTLCKTPQASDCLLVANCDLILARLNFRERREAWTTLHRGYPHRSRSLLIVMPNSADMLLPSEQELMYWRQEGRLVP
jgi:non-ribosomal peptide synthetase component F